MSESNRSKKSYESIQPICADLFSMDDPPTLFGGCERNTGRLVFPMPTDMSREDFERVGLGSVGTLWSWTVQRFRPKSPPYAGLDSFDAFALGYVDMNGAILVESRLINVNFAALQIGMKLRLALERFQTKAGLRMTFAFEPTE